MKVGYNYIGYKMAEQRSSWKGTDSINVSSVGNNDNSSILIKESESHYYANHTDTEGLIKKLTENEKTLNNHAEEIKYFSKPFSGNVDNTKFKFGPNNVPSEIVMSTKEEEKYR